jgi:hypothetical protein
MHWLVGTGTALAVPPRTLRRWLPRPDVTIASRKGNIGSIAAKKK